MSSSELSGRLVKVCSELDGLKSETSKTMRSVANLLEELNGKLENDKESKQLVNAIISHIEYLMGYSNG